MMFAKKRVYHLFIHLLVALVAAHFVVVNSTKRAWAELFTKSYYYTSLFYSMVIAYLLLAYIYWISKVIDRNFDGRNQVAKRHKYQFIFGFSFAAIIAFLLAMILFWINGENIFVSSYFKNLYVYILVFIFCVNIVHLYGYQHLRTPKLRYLVVNKDKAIAKKQRIRAYHKKEPAVIYAENKYCFSINFRGKKTVWPGTIVKSMEKLDASKYFQVNRTHIVHRAAIVSIQPHQTKTLKVDLIVKLDKELLTSRRKSASLKEWYLN